MLPIELLSMIFELYMFKEGAVHQPPPERKAQWTAKATYLPAEWDQGSVIDSMVLQRTIKAVYSC